MSNFQSDEHADATGTIVGTLMFSDNGLIEEVQPLLDRGGNHTNVFLTRIEQREYRVTVEQVD